MGAYCVWGAGVAGSIPVIPTMLEEIEELYEQFEVFLEEYRVEWEASRHIRGRKENYWQGKKDGLRQAMNMLHQIMQDNNASVD